MHALVPVAGSLDAVRAVRRMLRSGVLDRVTLLTVTARLVTASIPVDALLIPQATWDDLQAAEADAADDVLKSALAELAGFDTRVRAERRKGDVVQQIVSAAEELRADMIVMGRGGLGTLSGFVFGGVTQRVIDAANCPVLLVGASAGAARRREIASVPSCASRSLEPSA